MKENELSRAREEKTNIGNLILQYPKAGITFGDTIEEAIAKGSKWAGAQVAAPDLLSVAEAKSLGVPYGTTKQQAFGITPTTSGTSGAIGAEDITISPTIANKAAARGVPEADALGIVKMFRRGVPEDQIKNFVKNGGGDPAWIDIIKGIMSTEQVIINVPGGSWDLGE